jgi:hypothetical protein
MPLPGGATDKFGNRYEGLWTVQCMIDVISERVDSIRLEPPGAEGEGIEFWLKRDDTIQYHQVKRQNSPSGKWSIADLGNNKVLEHFWKKLQNPLASCVFVSTNSAHQIEELSDRSKRSEFITEFKNEFLKSKSASKDFAELCVHWNNCPEEEAYSALQRLEIVIISEIKLRTTLEMELGILIQGNAANAVDTLIQFALDKVHYQLSSKDIWNHLESRGYSRFQASKIGLISRDFGWTVPSYFIGRAEILDELTQAINQNSTVVVGGIAGIGKTYLVSRYIEDLDPNRNVLWLNCVIYSRIEEVLVRLAEYFNYTFGEETLLGLLNKSLGSLERRVEVAVKICENYQCTLVWDDFNPEDHATLLSLFQECNRIFRTGKLLITTRTSFDSAFAINPIYKLVVPPLKLEFGIELMRHYLERLGLEIYPDDILSQAYHRVDGHPYFLRELVILSETYPLPDILETLPNLQSQIQIYLQEKAFSHLTIGRNTKLSLAH